MKLSFDIDAPDAFCDIIDGITVVLLKKIRKDAENMLENDYGYLHKDDAKDAKKRIKAVNVLLDYYGEDV